MKLFLSAISAALVSVSLTAFANDDLELRQKLELFDKQPQLFMNQVPVKTDRSGRPVQVRQWFSPTQIKSRQYIELKNALRVKQKKIALPGRAGIQPNDNPAELVDQLQYRTLEQIEAARLTQARLKESPWSDDYWAINTGVLAKRYADRRWDADGWKQVFDFYSKSPDRSEVRTLSPAEKYDLLVGDKNFSMTKASVLEGKQYFDAYGKVETWMGICHGWAPAAYMLPRPEKAIVVTAADGVTKIPFYPSDIKALASLLWANGQAGTHFIGGRCDTKASSLKTDPANGRVINQDCFDTNPGAWHLAVVNQLGRAATSRNPADQMRTFVLDATFDYEVWNQPVVGYSYRYFNPATGQPARTLAEAKVDRASFRNDKFAKYRDAKTKSLVGVAFTVEYTVETSPTHRETDSQANDAVHRAQYLYDLELDARGNIIGGEWYQNTHPDFLWTPPAGSRAVSVGDASIRGAWDPAKPFPAAWTQAAIAASRRNQPLAAVVETLIVASRGGR